MLRYSCDQVKFMDKKKILIFGLQSNTGCADPKPAPMIRRAAQVTLI